MVIHTDLSGRISADVVELDHGGATWAVPSRMPATWGLTADTPIQTDKGLIVAEHLRAGDKVRTTAGTFASIAAHVCHMTQGTEPASRGGVLIAKGALGPGHPREDVIVGPSQHIRLTSPVLHGLCGYGTALVEAQDLIGAPGISCAPATSDPLVLLVLSEPAFFEADGLVVPGFMPSEDALRALGPTCRARLLSQAPRLRYPGASEALSTGLPLLDRREALAALGRTGETSDADVLHFDRASHPEARRKLRA